MGLFSKKSGDHPADASLLRLLRDHGGAERPRHWLHYLYCRDEDAAIALAAHVRDGGWRVAKIAPAPVGPTWLVLAERHDAYVTGTAVAAARAFFEGVVRDVPDGQYDGWEASA